MSTKRTKIGDDSENEDENPYVSLLPDMASCLLSLRNTTAESIFSSRPIKFVVGTKRAEFWIHSSLVTGQSPVLDRLMNWKTNDTVFLDTADETAFLCFSLYAHTGFYDPRKIFNSAPPQGSVDEWRLRLVCHAKTYNFADEYGIKGLKSLSCRLLEILLAYAKHDKTVAAGMPGVLRLCWQVKTPKAIKKLLLNRVVAQISTLWEDDGFQKILRERSDFALDVLARLATNCKDERSGE